jgi:glucan phosphoethanolaminetransferase (alkaline phosphatase superfamily)
MNPLQTFIQVFAFMSDNPTQLNVLFAGENYQAGEVPRRYILTLFGYTQTEPVWILFLLGLFLSFWKSNNQKRITLFIILLWFAIPLAYVLLRRPSMYDGYRHFLFILPPIFIFAGFAFEKIFEFFAQRRSVTAVHNTKTRKVTDLAGAILVAFILLFGIIPIIQLHPYQYAYYNNFAGGLKTVFRNYETEYWLTCYREAVLELNQITNDEINLFVRREPYIADYYANGNINVRDFRTEQSQMQSGDYYLVNTRSNEDLRFMRDVPALITVERQGAEFCLIKQVP